MRKKKYLVPKLKKGKLPLKRPNIKLPTSKTPTFREILRYLPGEMARVATSPVRYLGKFIKKQIRKELQFREEMQRPTREKAMKIWRERRKELEFEYYKEKYK